MATLTTKVILAKGIKMDRDYKNVVNYSESALLNLLQSNTHLVAQKNNASFVNPTGIIYVPFTYSQCLQANYIAFQNPNYDNKWFFAFIDEVIFHSINMQEIRYTIDSWSTWFSKVTTKTCFVEREHVNDDTVGKHTVDENLNVGELECISESEDTYLKGSHWIGVLTAWDPSAPTEQEKLFKGIAVYGGTVYGTNLFLFDIREVIDNVEYLNLGNLINFIWKTALDNHIEDIESIFFVSNVIPILADAIYKTVSFTFDETTYTSNYIGLQAFNECYAYENSITKETSNITGRYQIKNNKCFTYPYNFLRVTNNLGNSINLKYEFSSDTTMKLESEFTCTIGGSGRIYPKNYNGIANNIDMELPLGKLPVCGWATDSFTNWLTQEGINKGSSFLGNIIEKISGGEISGQTLETGKEYITQTLGKFSNTFLKDFVAPEGNTQGTSDINFVSGNTTFKFEHLRCKDEYMKQIDSYFTMYGYQVNELKTPNITGRLNYNFIKIAPHDDIGYGTIPSKDMQAINNACRRGVTIWHNHANLGNYSVSNGIVT